MSAATRAKDQTSASVFAQRGTAHYGPTESASGRAQAWKVDRPWSTEARQQSVDSSDDDIVFEPINSHGKEMHTSIHDRSRWAQATVLKVEPEYVTCEVHGVDRFWEVSLPRIFFPASIRYGTPVRIGIQNVNGYRTPVVESVDIRPTDADPELEKLRAELESI